jgi:hypothetical protein
LSFGFWTGRPLQFKFGIRTFLSSFFYRMAIVADLESDLAKRSTAAS